MKIIKTGNTPASNKTFQMVCGNCKSLLSCKEEDVVIIPYLFARFACKCPVCQWFIIDTNEERCALRENAVTFSEEPIETDG